jgi:glycosyltransferase involved in cell wall biosynthesis
MRISVVIPAYNEESSIDRCLESIKKQTYKDYDIIVVNAESTDKTAEVAFRYTDRVITAKTGSPGPARNLGVKSSASEVIAFTDADTIVADNWLSEIAKKFEDPKVVGAGGVLRPLDARLLDKVMFKINSDLWYRFTAVFGFYQLGTPNCAYRRSAFLCAGGFDEKLSMLEDTELSIRMKKYGKIVIDKNMIVYKSARRFKQEGYIRVFLRYFKEYINLFLLGKDVNSKHFDTIKH